MHPRGAVGARLIGGRVPHDGLCAPHPIASAGKSPHPQRHSIQSRRAHFSSRRTLQLNCPVPQIYNPPLPGRYTYLPTYRHRSRGLRWTRTINTTRDWGPCSLWLYTTRCVPGIYNQSIIQSNHTGRPGLSSSPRALGSHLCPGLIPQRAPRIVPVAGLSTARRPVSSTCSAPVGKLNR